MPFAWIDGAPLFFSPDDIRLLHWCPRSIVARVVRGSLRLVVVVLHAPTAADPARDRWWTDFKARLSRTVKRDALILLGDLCQIHIRDQWSHW